MFRWLVLALALLSSSPSWATWTLTQVKDNTTCNGTTCAVTVTSTGSAHLLVAGIISGSNITISSVTAGACSGTWTHAATSNLFVTGDGAVDLYYCTSSVSAQTSISIAISGNTTYIAVIWEASSSLGTIALDSGATPSSNRTGATCTACAGTSLTLSGNNDFIAGLSANGGTGTGVTGTGCTNDLANPGGDGVMHCITSGTGTYPATWAQSSATIAMDAAAFQETSGGAAAAGFNKRRKLETLGL